MMGRQKQQLKFTDINILQTWEQKPLVSEDSFYYGLFRLTISSGTCLPAGRRAVCRLLCLL